MKPDFSSILSQPTSCRELTRVCMNQQVPLVPLVPALSMLINIYLMVNLRAITWIQYAIYMVLGKFNNSRIP